MRIRHPGETAINSLWLRSTGRCARSTCPRFGRVGFQGNTPLTYPVGGNPFLWQDEPMSAITKTETGSWRVDFHPPGQGKGGRKRKQGFKTKREAQSWLDDQLRQYQHGHVVDDRTARTTKVADLWADFIAHVERYGVRGNRPSSPRTLRNYEYKWTHLIAPRWEYAPLSSITASACREWVDTMTTALGEPAPPKSVKEGADAFSRLLDFGVERGLLRVNHMKSRSGKPIPRPQSDDARANVFMTARQLDRLARVSSFATTMILTAGTTGLRWSEISGLSAGEVSLEEPARLIIPASRSKTNTARTVQLPAQVAERLRAEGVHEREADQLVFPASKGGPWSQSYFHKLYRPAASTAASAIATLQDALGNRLGKRVSETTTFEFDGKAVRVARYGAKTATAVKELQQLMNLDADGVVTWILWDELELPALRDVVLKRTPGLDDDRDLPARPVFHDLRHTAVSLSIQAGLNVKLVQAVAGHKTATVTLDTYAHLYPEDVGKAADAMTSILKGELA